MSTACEEIIVDANGSASRVLLSALGRLDYLLQQAIVKASETYGSKVSNESLRGLFITHNDVEQLLTLEPGAPRLQSTREGARLAEAAGSCPQFEWLRKSFGLSDFDFDLIQIALAPEIDLRYERLYAYLQDDVTRKRPTVDLALNLLCDSAEEKLRARVHFGPDAPLFKNRLAHLFPDPHQTQPPLLSHYFKLDDQVIRLLLGQSGLDARLGSICRLVSPSVCFDELHLNVEVKRALPFLLEQHRKNGSAVGLYFQGRPGSGRRAAAEALAHESETSLLIVDLAETLSADIDVDGVVKLICREARLQNSILYLEDFDAVTTDTRMLPRLKRFMSRLAKELSGACIIAGTQQWSPSVGRLEGVAVVPFNVPSFDERWKCWQRDLLAAGTHVNEADLNALAGRFRLTPAQIADAAKTARVQAIWHMAQSESPDLDGLPVLQPSASELFAAARRQTGHELAALAQKIEPVATWTDIVLPDDAMSQLREIVLRVVHRHRVLDEWGFDRKLSSGKGINALFAGASGTGKTMAAEVIANELGLELFKIDLASVVSKYIGETEKNLERIFAAAEQANAILFFDEADALFGKRSEVRDAHDRYANIEVAYLLQKMEAYEGVSLLATNLRQNMDEAFLRRLAFIINFPFPDAESRRRIWQGIWPAQISFAGDVDLDRMAQQFKLSGGNIKNIALAAAFHAADDGGCVSMAHLLLATRREYQKIGKVLPEADGLVAED